MHGVEELSQFAAQLHPAMCTLESRRDTILALEALERVLGSARAGSVAERELGIPGGKVPWQAWCADMEIVRQIAQDTELAFDRFLAMDVRNLSDKVNDQANCARAALSEAVRLLPEGVPTSVQLTAASYYLSEAWRSLSEAGAPESED